MLPPAASAARGNHEAQIQERAPGHLLVGNAEARPECSFFSSLLALLGIVVLLLSLRRGIAALIGE